MMPSLCNHRHSQGAPLHPPKKEIPNPQQKSKEMKMKKKKERKKKKETYKPQITMTHLLQKICAALT